MRIEQLRYLVTILERGSFRRASQELHMSQAALSEAIRNLERGLGARLMDRDRSGVRLTPVGEDVMPHVRAILESERALRDQVDGYRTLRRGQVSLGTVNAATNTILPGALSAFNEEYPGIQLRITETGSLDIVRAVKDAELDLGVVVRLEDEEVKGDELAFEDLLGSHVVLCVQRGHRLLSRESVSIGDVAEEPLILFRSGYLMHDLMSRIFGDRNLNIVYYTDNTESAKRMIATGVGVTLLPEFSMVSDLLSRSGEIVYCPLVGEYAGIRLSLTWRKRAYLPRAAQLLGSVIREEASRHPMSCCAPPEGQRTG
ncbi:MAG: LysR family transcriptional regulator [Streptosporangiales bacterium]|nr:LysR family transcriptional regulator [Streptosporangiales bacterium]